MSQNYPEQHRFCAFPDMRRPKSIKNVENLKIIFVQGMGERRGREKGGWGRHCRKRLPPPFLYSGVHPTNVPPPGGRMVPITIHPLFPEKIKTKWLANAKKQRQISGVGKQPKVQPTAREAPGTTASSVGPQDILPPKTQPPLAGLNRLEATFCKSDAIIVVVIYAKKFCSPR